MLSPECPYLKLGNPKAIYTSSEPKAVKWSASGKAVCDMGDCPMNRTFEGTGEKPKWARNNRKSAILKAEELFCLIRQKPIQ